MVRREEEIFTPTASFRDFPGRSGSETVLHEPSDIQVYLDSRMTIPDTGLRQSRQIYVGLQNFYVFETFADIAEL